MDELEIRVRRAIKEEIERSDIIEQRIQDAMDARRIAEFNISFGAKCMRDRYCRLAAIGFAVSVMGLASIYIDKKYYD